MRIFKGFTVLLFLCVVFMAQSGYSQELGLRLGDALGNKGSVAVDGVFALGKFSRVHADVSFGNGVGLEALWDFAFRPINNSPLYYYLGVGPSLFLGNPFGLGAAGEAGLEYRFPDAPVALGLDWRPTFVLVQNTDFTSGFGLNVRYVFNK